MSQRIALALIASSFVIAGCPGPNTPPPDGGPDAPSRDVPLLDVPGLDVPGTDVGPVDAPMPLDTPELDTPELDAPALPDVPDDAPTAFCGNGMVDGTEECDGTDLDGQDCTSVDPIFFGGTLDCATDCTFDTTACTANTCGDDVRRGSEVCDGTDVGIETCASRGFVSGTLGCAVDCTAYDTAMCSRCGNGTIDAGEACDGAALGGATCVSRGYDTGMLSCGATCVFNEGLCQNYEQPLAGEVVVTEVMPDPNAHLMGDAGGEWFEVQNRGAGTVDLEGCTVEDNQATPAVFTITSDVVLAPGERATFARSADPGFTPTFVYPGSWALANSGTDRIRIVCSGTTVDNVDYTTAFPWSVGTAMQLDPTRIATGANDAPGDWCAATASYNGDLGTPGGVNRSCFSPEVCTGGMDEDGDGATDCADTDCTTNAACRVWPVTFCRLQSPLTITAAVGAPTTVYGRVYAAGLTDTSGTNDPHPRLVAAVGVGPDGSDPASAAGWTWTTAMPNAGYGPASPGYEMNNDEYQANLAAPGPPGSFDYAYRFSGDGGTTWVYCDGQPAGSSDGYQTANAGALTSTPAGSLVGLVINEVDYNDAATDDRSFIEIYNGTGGPVSLTNLAVVLVNGNATPSPEYQRYPLLMAGASLPAGGYLVIRNTTVTVPAGVLTMTGTGDFIQNGNPDGIALIDTSTNTVIDALSYQNTSTLSVTMASIMGFTGTVSLVEGTALAPSVVDTADDLNSLSRVPNGTDTNNAASDWMVRPITPGAAN